MALPKKEVRRILQASIELQRNLLKILDTYSDIARAARLNEPVENLHIQELWVLRNALLPAATIGPELKAGAELMLEQLQLVLDEL